MSKVLMSVAIAAVLAIAPAAMAKEKEKKALKSEGSQQMSEILKQEGQNREPLGDGTFQGKPVVEGPADWSKGGSGSASSGGADTGASSGASGGESGSSDIKP
jgi:hypothetical protein